jgi:hypothetical protein
VDVVANFVLNVVQSVDERYPCVEALAAAIETLPPEYMSGEENVVVAVQVGIPFKSARTVPAVPAEVVARAEEPLPYGIAPLAMFAHPVPPFTTGRMPVMSVARLITAVESAPAVPFKKPVSDVARVPRFGADVRVPMVDVALIRASARTSV